MCSNIVLERFDRTLDQIQSKLVSMGNVAEGGKEHLENIRAQVSSLVPGKDDTFLVNSTFFMTAFSGAGESAFRAYKAFSTEPPSVMDGSAQLMQMVGSAAQLLTFAGKFGGAFGVILGEILGFVASFLVGLGPKQKPLGDELREVLREFSGEETVNRLGGVLDSLELQQADFKKQKANSKTWDQILGVGSFERGPEIIWLGDAVAWLGRDANQKVKAWPYVFEGYLLSAQQYLENLILAFNALKKTDDQGERLDNEDMDRAGSVLETICDHYDTFIKEVGPVALNKGKVWHIGTSEEVYSREMAVSDSGWDSLGGVSTRLSVVAAGGHRLRRSPHARERIWTIGTGNHVWTGYGASSNWKKTSIKADDIWVVKQDPEFSAGKGSVSDVYTIEDGGGKFCWRTWDEAIEEDVRKPEPARWEKFVGEKYSVAAPAGDKFGNVVAIGNGTVYLFLASLDWRRNPLYVWNKSTRSLLLVIGDAPGGSRKLYKGIAISKENIYVLFKDRIYFSAHEDVRALRPVWKEFGGPASNPSFEMPDEWSYDQLFPSDDGSLLATIQKKIYLWDGQKWRKNERGGDEAVRLIKLPVRGWEIYVAVKNLVEEVRKIKPVTSIISSPA